MQNQKQQQQQQQQDESDQYELFPEIEPKYEQWEGLLQDKLISEQMLKTIYGNGFETPNPIQSRVLPPLLQGNRSALFQGQSGSGKSLILHVMSLQKLQNVKQTDMQDRSNKIIYVYMSSVLAYTQYVLLQNLAENFLEKGDITINLFLSKPKVNTSGSCSEQFSQQQQSKMQKPKNDLEDKQRAISEKKIDEIGNRDNRRSMQLFKESDVVMGTLGKVSQLISNLKQKGESYKVILLAVDEADSIFDQTFRQDERKKKENQNQDQQSILDQLCTLTQSLQPSSQIVLYSATFVDTLLQNILDSKILTDADTKPFVYYNGVQNFVKKNIQHIAIKICHESDLNKKIDFLKRLMSGIRDKGEKALIFLSKVDHIQQLIKHLDDIGMKKDFAIEAVYKGLGDNHNTNAVSNLAKGALNFILCTDGTLGRGIDICSLQNVIQFDIPRSASQQFQQAGRAGRQNKQGTCYYLCYDFEFSFLRNSQEEIDYQIKMIDLEKDQFLGY